MEQRVGDALQRTADAEAALREARSQAAAQVAAARAAAAESQELVRAASRREQDAQHQLKLAAEECDRCAESGSS